MNIHFVILAEDNGNNPAMDINDIPQILQQTSSYFSSTGISFSHSVSTARSTRFRNLFVDDLESSSENGGEVEAMKRAFSENPQTQTNIFVTGLQTSDQDSILAGFALTPWSSAPLSSDGGVVMNGLVMTPQYIDDSLAHELGHVYGLHHTFRGVDEVRACSTCYEEANRPSSEGDRVGDLCSDTPAAPVDFDCVPPSGTDCRGQSWLQVASDNVMSYTECSNSVFTSQQSRRMRCWIESTLPSLVRGFSGPTPDISSGNDDDVGSSGSSSIGAVVAVMVVVIIIIVICVVIGIFMRNRSRGGGGTTVITQTKQPQQTTEQVVVQQSSQPQVVQQPYYPQNPPPQYYPQQTQQGYPQQQQQYYPQQQQQMPPQQGYNYPPPESDFHQ